MLLSHDTYMRRALRLAANGLGNVSPNPMVGAVVVAPDGSILGEGFHRRFGEAHAEVNAINAIPAELRRRDVLSQCTMYVTLEPCSHFGKTPPCSLLVLKEGIGRVVVGASDPFERVNGRGIDMLRDGGVEVETGILEHECKSLNASFFTSHLSKRPFITLKWAQSADGFMDVKRNIDVNAKKFSDKTGTLLVHRLRANHDAVGVGSGTVISDCPQLNVREWYGVNPRKVFFDRTGRCGTPTGEIEEVLSDLYANGVISILVEGGPTLLTSFIRKGLWDLARIEVSAERLDTIGSACAPGIPKAPFATKRLGGNTLYYYSNNPLVNPFFIEYGL